MSAKEIEIIRSAPSDAWSVVCLVCVDWYDGVECGFVVLDGPARLGAAVERIGGSRALDVYHGWLVPDSAVEVIAQMGEAYPPVSGWCRHFTLDAPMDLDAVTGIARDVDPSSLLVVLDKHSGRLVAITVVDREWDALPRPRAFGVSTPT